MRLLGDGGNSTDGLVYNLYQNGFLPMFLNDFDDPRLFQSKLLILPASARSWSAAEVERLDQYCEGGRTAVAAVGYPDRIPFEPLLTHHKMRLIENPLGYGVSDCKTWKPGVGIRFYSAWPIEGGSVPVAIARKIPVAVADRVGKGMFVLIGDSFFLTLKNLEGYQGAIPENVEFLHALWGVVKSP
jgi:hypothetical protein